MDVIAIFYSIILGTFIIGLLVDFTSPSLLLYITSGITLLVVTWGSGNQLDTFQRLISGCSHPVIVLLGCLSIISSQFPKSHFAPFIEKKLTLIESKTLFTFYLILITTLLSSIINNALVVASLIPIVQRVCKHRNWNYQIILLTLSFSSMLGGTITLIGSSTNLIASSLLSPELNLDIFSLATVSIPTCLLGTVYLTMSIRKKPTLGRCCLPYLRSENDTLAITTKILQVKTEPNF